MEEIVAVKEIERIWRGKIKLVFVGGVDSQILELGTSWVQLIANGR